MRILAALIAAAALSAPAFGQTITERGDQALDVYRFTEEGGPILADAPLPTGPTTGAPIYDFKTKSVAKAFALSLLVPGAGQFYTGSKLKGAIFLGIEALGWLGYFKYDGEGDDITAEYEQYARTHWVEQAYWDSLESKRTILKWQDDEVFPHHLPYTINENGDTVGAWNHEYYENIGKYDQFVWGWDDLQQFEDPINSTNPEVSFQSARRKEYVGMREDANQKYDHARAAGIVVIANHLVSALEAAFSAKRYNSQAQHARRIDVDLKVVNLEDTPTPWVRVAYSF